MRIMMVGDTHGGNKFIERACYEAGSRKIQHVLVLGDFGLWTHFADGHDFLDATQEAARINNLSVYAIGGNHENWDHWNWFVDNMPTHKGFAMVRRRVLIAPKVHKWTWDNKVFGAAGGAVSIDKDDRLINEQKTKYGPRTLWWPNEQLTDEDTIRAKELGKVDYLITHDCSDHTTFRNRLKPDPESQRHRRRIDAVIKATQPAMHFHGHMHTRYEWDNTLSHGFYSPDEPDAIVTRTYGLECNNDWNAWGVLDTELEIFKFRGEGMQFRSLGNTEGLAENPAVVSEEVQKAAKLLSYHI